MACAAAAATLHVINEERLLDNAAARGQQLMSGLRALADKYSPHVIDVRGRGLMVAFELSPQAGLPQYSMSGIAKV